MSITIEVSSELEGWLNAKAQKGEYASPADFILDQLANDRLEEEISEALLEPSTPLTADDWAELRRNLASEIAAHNDVR
jgi:Arc/MetJ-type ribon-helix-helix transcriptional regulator